MLEASREAHAALASNTLKLEDKLTRCSAKIDTLQNTIQENSARDGSRFTTFAKMLEDVRVSSASVGRPARDNGDLNSEALSAWIDKEYVPILQNTVAEAMHQAKDVATQDKMDTTQGQEKDAAAKFSSLANPSVPFNSSAPLRTNQHVTINPALGLPTNNAIRTGLVSASPAFTSLTGFGSATWKGSRTSPPRIGQGSVPMGSVNTPKFSLSQQLASTSSSQVNVASGGGASTGQVGTPDSQNLRQRSRRLLRHHLILIAFMQA